MAEHANDRILRVSEVGTSVEAPGYNAPATGALSVTPNPFTGQARIDGSRLPAGTAGQLAVYDVSGRLIRELGEVSMGTSHAVACWDSRDDHGRTVEPGTFFVRLATGSQVIETKIIHLR